jgi:gliding motility-associated-like protein
MPLAVPAWYINFSYLKRRLFFYGVIPLLFSFLYFTCPAQLPNYQWSSVFTSTTFGSGNLSNARSVCTDANGNVYSAGLLAGTIDLDPGPGVYNLSGAGGNYGLYVSKLDINGNFVWAKKWDIAVQSVTIELKVDRYGNVYFVSDLGITSDMDPGPGVLMMSPTSIKDAFTVKLDTNGNLVWVKKFGGIFDSYVESSAIEIDPSGNIIMSGIFTKTVDFDPGPGIFNITSSAHSQAYMLKLTSNGDLIWAKQFGNSPVVYEGSGIGDIKCDLAGNIYSTGIFNGICDFDPGPGTYNIAGIGIQKGFISKLNTNGDFVWAKAIVSDDLYGCVPSTIGIDSMNNVITAGHFSGTFDFDPGPAVHNITAGIQNNQWDGYILKLNNQGDFIWAHKFGGSEYDAIADLAIDSSNNILVIGTSRSTGVDFDPGPGVTIINSPSTGAEFLAKLTPKGNLIYAHSFLGPAASSASFRRMWMDSIQNIYVTGNAGFIDFDPSPLTTAIKPDVGLFVLKLSQCSAPSKNQLTVNACSVFTLNNLVYDSSGSYEQVISNYRGCDSLITLNLTINKKKSQQSKEICEGSSFFAGGSYQTVSGTYIDTLYTITGCDSVVTTFLTVHPKPYPMLGPDKEMCAGDSILLTPGMFDQYQWQDGSSGPGFTVKAAGVYWVTVTNEFNCKATDSFTLVNLHPLPGNFLKEKDSLCSYEGISLTPDNSYPLYLWSNGAATKKITIQVPGTYWLKVKDAYGCSGTDTITVYAKQCISGIYIPTAFTPNADGKNDNFKALVYAAFDNFHLSVYDRWGQIVFQTSDPLKGWDGKVGNIESKPDIYIWVCEYRLKNKPPKMENGTVMLLR